MLNIINNEIRVLLGNRKDGINLYKIILHNRDELVIFKVKEINWDILTFIKWRYGYFDLVNILSGQDAEQFEPTYYIDSKEEILNDLEKCMGISIEKLNHYRKVINKYFV